MDDNVPLIEEPNANRNFTIHRIIGAVLLAVFVILLSLTVLFSLLYFGSRKEQLPPWLGLSNNQTSYYSRAAVASDNVRCSEIGRNVMIEGGNAVDAAIAVILCLGVVNPMSSGLGGGHFMTIYNATTGKCSVVDAREIAPLAASQNMFDDNPKGAQKGWRAMAVPGELHGLRTEYINFGGKLPWARLFQPSIEMLTVGVPVSQALAAALKEEEKNVVAEPSLSEFLDAKTRAIYKFGDIIKSRTLLRDTMKYLAKSSDPIREFYKGSITELLVAEFEENGGIITAEDFKNYTSIIRKDSDVIVTELNGRFICGPPPPSSSAITQSIIKIMDSYASEFDQSKIKTNVDILHTFLEASKFAYAMRGGLGDMAFEQGAMDIARNITSDAFVKSVHERLGKKPHSTEYYGGKFAPLMDEGTSNLAVLDAQGNAVVATTTINLLFGSQVASESTGIIWNSQMDDFSLPKKPNFYGYPPSPANYIRPGKRPLSSISPLVVVNKESKQVELVVGAAGGSTIISSVSSIAHRVLTLGWDLKTAVDAPRIHNQLIPNVTEYEPRFPQQYITKLRKRGHIVNKTLAIGEATALYSKNGRLYASSDWRKGTESQPAGF